MSLAPLLLAPALATAAPARPFPASPPLRGPHAEQLRLYGELPPAPAGEAPPGPPPRPPDSPSTWVYGYWPYWGDSLETVPWEHLTHVAIFSVGLEGDGSLSSLSHWTSYAAEAVSLGHAAGVRVHLCATCFDGSTQASLLGSSSHRAAAVSNLVQQVRAYGADGINLDIEALSSSLKEDLVAFVEELRESYDGDIVLAMPAVDWWGSYDYDRLAAASDGLFIMGYDYHWSGGDPGPLSPLYASGTWGSYCLDWTVEDYLEWGAPEDKLVLGLPLYGYDWPTTGTQVPGTATGTATAVFYSSAVATAEAVGRHWDAASTTPYAFPSSSEQLWYEDAESIEAKVAYAVGRGLLGVGFWALTYDGGDPELWSRVSALAGGGTGEPDTGAPGDTGADTGSPGSSGSLRADAGPDLWARVGEEVVLDGSASSGPGELDYTWTQVEGPAVELSGEHTARPRFTLPSAGVYAFDLQVTAGGSSALDRCWVVGLSEDGCPPGGDCPPRACGCAAGGGGAAGLFALLGGLLGAALRRRRAPPTASWDDPQGARPPRPDSDSRCAAQRLEAGFRRGCPAGWSCAEVTPGDSGQSRPFLPPRRK